MALNLLSGQPLSLRSLIGAMLPNNYFVTLYITVYLLSPYINILLGKLSQKQFGMLLCLCLCLFSVWPTVLDVGTELTGISFSGMYTTNTDGSQYGYSLINFTLMYLIGSYLRRFDVGKKFKSAHLAIGTVFCVCVLFAWQLRFAQTARSYANPFVITVGVLVFLLFQRITVHSKIINTLAKGSFTCFLLHDLFLWFIGIEKVVNGNTLVMLGHLVISVVGIFLISWMVWRIYSWVTAPIFCWLGGKLTRVDKLISVSGENEL